MRTQTLPRPAREYAAEQRREIGAALAATQRLWRRMGDDFDASYARIERELLTVADTAQRRVARGAVASTPEVMRETAPQALRRPAAYALDVDSLVGTTGAGWDTQDALYGSVVRAKTAVKGGASVEGALASAGLWLDTKVGTLLSDTGRTAEKVTASGRGVGLYVRMLNPPSCGRCVILAGRRTRSSVAFLRHPGCDCRNIPAAESIAGDLTVDPHAYLDNLSDQDLARTLGSKANAEAFRLGADQNQLINAYRRKGDVRAAQIFGRNVRYTTEGTTRRAWAYQSMQRAGMSPKTPRLMPESIFALATDQADARRMLRLYGWIL